VFHILGEVGLVRKKVNLIGPIYLIHSKNGLPSSPLVWVALVEGLSPFLSPKDEDNDKVASSTDVDQNMLLFEIQHGM
jgi:hypothetical protein